MFTFGAEIITEIIQNFVYLELQRKIKNCNCNWKRNSSEVFSVIVKIELQIRGGAKKFSLCLKLAVKMLKKCQRKMVRQQKCGLKHLEMFRGNFSEKPICP